MYVIKVICLYPADEYMIWLAGFSGSAVKRRLDHLLYNKYPVVGLYIYIYYIVLLPGIYYAADDLGDV